MAMRTARTMTFGLVAAVAVVGLTTMPSVSAQVIRTAAAPAAVDSAPAIVPKPVSMTSGSGTFTLSSTSRIVTKSAAARKIGADLAADLAPATGFHLPVTGGSFKAGDIQLVIGDPGTLGADTLHQGYQLTVTSNGVTLVAPTANGLFNGVQTILQLMPAWIASPTLQPGPWTMPAVSVTDYPRYDYRGVMVDIARHFEPPAAIERIIDYAASQKMNVLHLHLSDDQGFRVVIKGFPNLTAIGGQASLGTDGRVSDPGGFWTQAQYKQVVAYAKAHFMTVIPEIDTPSHTNAIVMSEYQDTKNKKLNGTPGDINCGLTNPPVWNYTGDVGYSGLCANSANTWAILSAITSQLAAMSSSKYYNIGGDEAANVFNPQQYAQFINKELPLVKAAGKIPMGWADGFATVAGTKPPAGSIAEAWEPGATDATAAVSKGMKIVMAPADRTYVDQSYPNDNSGLGLGWACRGCDLDRNYNWDPATLNADVPTSSIYGVEGALWSETIPELADAEYLLLPRLMAVSEIAWSPTAARTGVTSPAFVDFAGRLAAQGPRLQAAGLNFYTTKQVPWGITGTGGGATINDRNKVVGTLAKVSAPGLDPSMLTASIDWGDGTKVKVGTIAGTGPTPGRVNGLYTVTGQHTYSVSSCGGAATCVHTVTITVTSSTGITGTFTVTV